MNNAIVKNFTRKLDNLLISDYHGLRNQGATCYLNSVLQILFMNKDFREAIKKLANVQRPTSETMDLQLARLFTDLEKCQAETHHITASLGISKIGEQQDAAEYFERILNRTSPEASRIFRGILVHTHTCCVCQRQSVEEAAFWTLPLSVEDTFSHSYSVHKGFKEFFRASKVSSENRLYCEWCLRKVDAMVECEIKYHPKVLTLLLKRFKFDYHILDYVKNDCLAEVPSILQIKNFTYDLYGVVDHYGSLKGGHITATIKSYETGEWYHFDDALVKLVRPPLCKAGVEAIKSCEAYLLMYKTDSGEAICNQPQASKMENVDKDESGSTEEFNWECHQTTNDTTKRAHRGQHALREEEKQNQFEHHTLKKTTHFRDTEMTSDRQKMRLSSKNASDDVMTQDYLHDRHHQTNHPSIKGTLNEHKHPLYVDEQTVNQPPEYSRKDSAAQQNCHHFNSPKSKEMASIALEKQYEYVQKMSSSLCSSRKNNGQTGLNVGDGMERVEHARKKRTHIAQGGNVDPGSVGLGYQDAHLHHVMSAPQSILESRLIPLWPNRGYKNHCSGGKKEQSKKGQNSKPPWK